MGDLKQCFYLVVCRLFGDGIETTIIDILPGSALIVTRAHTTSYSIHGYTLECLKIHGDSSSDTVYPCVQPNSFQAQGPSKARTHTAKPLS